MSKNFYYLIIAYSITMMGSRIGSLAQMFKSFEISNAVYGISILLLLRMFSMILMNPINFKILNKFNLKKIIIFSELSNGIVTFLIIFFSNNFLILIFLATLSSILNCMFRPAYFSLISKIEKKKNLNKVNSILSTIDTVITFLGYSISGALILYKGIKITFFIDAFSYLFSVPLYFLIKDSILKIKTKTEKRENYLDFFRNNSNLISFINVNFVVWLVCGFFSAIELPFLKNIILLDNKIVGHIFSISAVGNLIGVLISNKFLNKVDNIIKIYYIDSFLIIVKPIFYTFLGSEISFFIYAFISGTLIVILKNSLNMFIFLQEKELQGRYFNHLFLINHLGMALGLIIATFINIPSLYIVSLRIISLISIFSFFLLIIFNKKTTLSS